MDKPELPAESPSLALENAQLRQRLSETEARSRQLAERLQELVNDSEARFSAIFRDAAVGILLVDVQGRVVMANPAASRILGYTQVELRGSAAFELNESGTTQDTALFEELVQGRRDKYRLERRYTRQAAAPVWASLTVSLIRGAQSEPEYAIALIEDITERREAEESSKRLIKEQGARAEAEAARRRIAFLAEASVALASSLDPRVTLEKLVRLAVPILGDYCLVDVQDPDGTVRRVTEAAADLQAEALLRKIARVPARHALAGPVLEVLRNGKTRLIASIDARPLTEPENLGAFERMGGGVLPVSILIVPLLAGARTLGAIVFGTTQKERAYSDDDVGLAEEFAHRAALAIENTRLYHDAKEASRLKDDFLAVVSHELRTPLMPILGWAQLLRDENIPKATLATGLATIERNARSQARLIDDLLDVSRIISGKLRLDVKKMALGPAIEEAIESVRAAAKAKTIRVNWTQDPEAPQVVGDSTRMQQIVWNLVANAIKFTPPGGQVEVKLEGIAGKAVISVSDTGDGISPDFLPHLFERFRQAEAATTRKHGGLGLGLSIVRHLVELHGGTVAAQSAGPAQGSVFTVTLPPAAEEEPAPAPDRATARATDKDAPNPRSLPPRLTGLRLLVVDDQPDTLELLVQMLTGLGAKVLSAHSAADALRVLCAEKPDLLISDIGMPVQDGYALIQQIRALPAEEGGMTPAIALTAFARTEDRVRALQSGFQTHVPKPVEPAELAAVVLSLAPKPPPTPPSVVERAPAAKKAGKSATSRKKKA